MEEKVEPQKTPKPGRIGREAQEDPKAQWTPELVEGIQRLREEFPLLRKGSFSILLRKAGFTVGSILKSLKNLWAFERGRETEEGCCAKKPTGESKTPSHEKTLKTSKVASPKDPILQWAYSSPV